MTDSQARATYEEWHAGLDTDVGGQSPWQQMVLEVAGPLIAGSRVLEIGCGRGGFVPSLCTAGAREVVAADFSETAVAKARAHAADLGLSNVEFRVEDIEAIALPSDSFDLVVSCETIEHVPDPRQAMAELARVLRPSGRLVLTTPNYLSTVGLHRAWRELTGRPYSEGGQPICHVTMLPRTVWWAWTAGLKPIHVATRGHYFPIPGRRSGPADSHIPRVLQRPASLFGRHSIVLACKRATARSSPDA